MSDIPFICGLFSWRLFLPSHLCFRHIMTSGVLKINSSQEQLTRPTVLCSFQGPLIRPGEERGGELGLSINKVCGTNSLVSQRLSEGSSTKSETLLQLDWNSNSILMIFQWCRQNQLFENLLFKAKYHFSDFNGQASSVKAREIQQS